MIISTKKGTPKEELEKIVDKFEKQGLDVTLITGKDYNVFGLVGDTTKIDERDVLANPWIDNVTRVSAPYKRANRLFHPADSVIDCGGVKIGSKEKIAVMAGPCSIENAEQALRIAQGVKAGGAALFRTMGHSDVSLKVSLLMNSINVIGTAGLIFGFGMDVAGVAIPTLVSRTVAAVVILSLLFNRDLMLHLSDIRGFHLNMRLMKNIFYIGVPSGVENGMFQLGRLVLFSLISTFGTASMVAHAIGNTISNFNCFAGQAINLGLAAVVSQCVGAGEFDQARAYLRKIVKWTYGIMAVVNLTIIALLPLIMRVYNVSPEAEKLAVTVTLIHGISSIFIWVPAFMVPGFLRAAGDARFTMLASMLTMWVVRVMLAYVLGKYMGYGVIGVWFAHAIVDWSVRSVIFFLRYRSGKWETMGIKT